MSVLIHTYVYLDIAHNQLNHIIDPVPFASMSHSLIYVLIHRLLLHALMEQGGRYILQYLDELDPLAYRMT